MNTIDLEEITVEVPIKSFYRLMTNCCNQNNCLDNPKDCLCCQETDINLEEMIKND